MDTAERAPSWWEWSLAVVVTIGSIASNTGAGTPGPVALGTVLALAALAPILVPGWVNDAPESRWGPLAPAFTGLVAGGYLAAGFTDGPIFLTLPGVGFAVAVQQPVRRWWRGLLVGCAALVGGLLVRELWQPGFAPVGWQAVGVAALAVASAALGAAWRSRGQARAERGGRAAAEEQLRMAQELHDGVGHGLAVVAMQAGVALHVLDSDPAKARASLEAIRETSRESLATLRAELAGMTGGSAPRTPAPGMTQLPALIDRVRAAGLDVTTAGTGVDVSGPVGELVHAVVQEALTNVLRHAQASAAVVRLTHRDALLIVEVEDDGLGALGDPGEGLGLAGMRRRVEAAGGNLSAGPAARGWIVRAEVPR